MADVTWLPHAEYDGYEVSSDGRVRSVDRYTVNSLGRRRFRHGQEIKTYVTHNGYLIGHVSINGTHFNFKVHRMVCETFHGPPPSDDHVVRHLNGDKVDNRVENLAWGTPSENVQDSLRHGTNNMARRTRCKHRHAYTPDNVRITKSGARKCMTCQRATWVKRQDKINQRLAAEISTPCQCPGCGQSFVRRSRKQVFCHRNCGERLRYRQMHAGSQ